MSVSDTLQLMLDSGMLVIAFIHLVVVLIKNDKKK